MQAIFSFPPRRAVPALKAWVDAYFDWAYDKASKAKRLNFLTLDKRARCIHCNNKLHINDYVETHSSFQRSVYVRCAHCDAQHTLGFDTIV